MGSFDNASVKIRLGGALQYHEEGRSSDTVILLHGLNAHSGTWRRNIPVLSRSWRTIAPTLPPSYSLEGAPLIEVYTERVGQLISELRLRSIAIVGNSLGGWMAMRLALRLPGLVRSLVLEDTAGLTGDVEPQPLAPRIDRLGIPVLVVWGENDGLFPPRLGKELHASIKRSEFALLRGAGHVPHWESAEEFNRIVEAFLNRSL